MKVKKIAIDSIIELLSSVPDGNIFKVLKDGKYNVILDEGSITTTNRFIAYDFIYWRMIREKLPYMVIDEQLCLQTHIKDDAFDDGAVNRLATEIYKKGVEYDRSPDNRKTVLKGIMEATNNLTNAVVEHQMAYIDTIDCLDYKNINRHPDLVQAKSAPKPYSESDIANIYETAHGILMDPEIRSSNNLANAYQQRTIKRGQALQAVATRGKVAEINGTVFPNAISSSFIEGLDNPVDIAMESRSAVMAAMYTDRIIAMSEYIARLVQIACMTIKHIDYGTNCGSTDYIKFIPKENEIRYLEGMYYLTDNNTLMRITPDSTDIVNKEIKLRWVGGCKHPSDGTICEVCYGNMSMNMFPTTTVGHYASAAIDNKRSQLMLSIKHYLTSVKQEGIVLRKQDSVYMTVEDLGIKINSEFFRDREEIKLHIPEASALVMGVAYNEAGKVTDVEPGIRRIQLSYLNPVDNTRHKVNIVLGKRGSELYMSEELVEYAKKHMILSGGNYVIDMGSWDIDNLVFFGIGRAQTLKDHLANYIDYVKFAGKGRVPTPPTPEVYQRSLFRFIIESFDAHFTHVAVVTTALTAADPANNDWRGPKYGTPETRRVVSIYRKVPNGSLGGALAFETIATLLKTPATYISDKIESNAMDVLFCPEEALKYEERGITKPLPQTFNGEQEIAI